MEMPAVCLAVERLHVVEPVSIIESDKSDALDEQSCTEAGAALQIERIEKENQRKRDEWNEKRDTAVAKVSITTTFPSMSIAP